MSRALLGSGKAGALAQFHQRTIAQLQHGVRIFSGADLDAVGQGLAGLQRLDAVGGNLVERAVDGLHDGGSGASAVLVVGDPNGDPGSGDHHGGSGPPVVNARLRGAARQAWQPRGLHKPGGSRRTRADGLAARWRAPRKGGRRGNRESALGSWRNRRCGRGAVVLTMSAHGRRFRSGANARPHAGGGGFHHGIVNGLVADIGHGLVKFLVHATPP